MQKFKDIKSLYQIIEVKDECVILQINKRVEKLYIYKVEPLLFLDLSLDVQNNIINVYNQILREINFNFQILISNRKLNIDDYIEKYLEYDENISSELYNKYVEDLKEKLKTEDIYEETIYIVLSENAKDLSKKEQYENVIYKLENLGCKVECVHGKKNYEQLLYKYLNKC